MAVKPIHQWLAKVGPYQECMCGFWVQDKERTDGSRSQEIKAHDKLVES